jgi:hypothetical protein
MPRPHQPGVGRFVASRSEAAARQTIFVAAGGGGDAITGVALADALGLVDGPPVILSYAWDRLIVDPLPGPRSEADFTGLATLADDVLEVIPTTTPRPPAGSTLPRLAAEVSARLLLLDPVGGAVGMARQIGAAADHFRADAIALVDVGGDILTTGADEGLRSPLADLLALAACSLVDRSASVLVAAPGIDGELPEEVVVERIKQLGGELVTVLGKGSFATVRHVLSWHPSEGSGLLAVAAEGARGVAEVRDAGSCVRLTHKTPSVYAVGTRDLLAAGPASALCATESLADANSVVSRLTGVSEIDYETRKAVRQHGNPSREPRIDDLVKVDAYAAEARARGVDFISVRRIAELLGATSMSDMTALRQLLAAARRGQYEPPVYRTL